MKKIWLGLQGLMLVSILTACASSTAVPASTTPALISTVAVTPLPPVIIPWIKLDDARIASDLEKLQSLSAARTSDDIQLIQKWNTDPVVRWNEETRYWVMYYAQDPVVASREYAMISIAQQRALDEFARTVWDRSARQPQALNKNIQPVVLASDPYEDAVLIGATEPLLLYLFPGTSTDIQKHVDEARQSLLKSGTMLPTDLNLAEKFGKTFATRLIEERKDDGSANAQKVDSLPSGEGIWKPDAFHVKPEQPGWGKVTPWLMSAPDEFRAPPPPAFGSPEFKAEVEKVRQQLLDDTQKEYAIAQKWADKRGTFTPPGHWNLIAASLIEQYHVSNRDATHIMAVMNMAMMDAGIACWDTKFHYMVVRPWQADPSITPLVGYPNHPSYPSGHSCFSWSAAEVLSYFFPQERDSLTSMAEEASISRVYAGIHYHMDIDAGAAIGRQVGELAVKYAASHNWDLKK
jgi:hypothetical protein